MPSKDISNSFASMRDKILSESGKDYWRSIDEMAETPEFAEFVKREYPLHSEDWDNSFNRRTFVKLMGGTLALAGLSGCVIQPPEKIVPRVRDVEDMLPGKSLFFATAMTLGGLATGLLAESYEGRPIKLEGNPEHPGSLGATDVLAQASLMDMYDADRSQQITYRGSQRTWQNFMQALRAEIEKNRADGGAGIRFLSETVTSPTLQAQMKKIAAELPNSRWYQYEPVNSDNAMAGARLAFGQAVNTVYKYDLAERILTLDKDIFSDFNVRYIKDFAKKKNFNEQHKEINRLYAVESTMTLTGAKADHRLGVKPSQVAEVAKAIAAAVGVGGPTSASTENAQWIATMARDLQEHKGRSIVVAGDHQPPVVHALAHAINGALGNVGQTVLYTDPLAPFTEKTQVEQLRELVADLDSGRVRILVFLGGNPVYNSPADLKLDQARLEKAPFRVHLGTHVDETGELCQWHVPQKHYLESWGDARAFDGTVTLIQPLIEKLYDSRSVHELIQLFMREDFDKNDLDIVKGYWQTQTIAPAATSAATPQPVAPPTSSAPSANLNTSTHTEVPQVQQRTDASRDTITIAERPSATPSPSPQTASASPVGPRTFEDNWRKAVHDGFVANTALPARSVSASTAFLSQPPTKAAASGSLEISILPDPTVFDGRFANNGWLQELPKPLNKVTWDNVALLSPATARRLGLNRANDPDEISGAERPTSFISSKGTNVYADLVTIKFNGGEVRKPVPVWITPGQPDDVVTLFMGGGRTRAGRIGTDVGYSVFDVMRSDAMNLGSGELSTTGEKTEIASTQIHFNMEGRDVLRVFDIDVFEANPTKWHQEDFYEKSMYYEASREYQKQYAENNRWGMTIDLNSCVGCNACVIACQAENNIPVVGKEQVNRSREMHWMRIDAYYGGDDISNAAGPHFQPVLCMQCEQAPCEVVCPVTATVHNAEGLNDMVYNRCVGTRYCSNNCPYKVRRFNFLLYQDWDTPQYKLMRNPEVSIRSRGVMEKCTYCTQRISAARIEAQKEGRPIADGEVITACQAVCPTDAIVFGDLNDAHSKVSLSKKDHRNYNLLNELNTQPRTTYLAGLKNRNKEMPDFRPLKEPPSHAPVKEEGKEKPAEGGH